MNPRIHYRNHKINLPGPVLIPVSTVRDPILRFAGSCYYSYYYHLIYA